MRYNIPKVLGEQIISELAGMDLPAELVLPVYKRLDKAYMAGWKDQGKVKGLNDGQRAHGYGGSARDIRKLIGKTEGSRDRKRNFDLEDAFPGDMIPQIQGKMQEAYQAGRKCRLQNTSHKKDEYDVPGLFERAMSLEEVGSALA